MFVKSQEDIDIERRIEKKPVFSVKNIFLFVIQMCIAVGIISGLTILGKIPIEKLSQLSIINMVSTQTSISLLSITIMQLILPDGKERVFGVTYQSILFKWKVLRHFNALDCMLYMLLLMIINILLSIGSVITNNYSQNICKMCFIYGMIETLILAIYMVYLGLITKFKKSRIYYLLFKRIRKRNTRSYEVYNMLLKGMKNYPLDSVNKASEYIEVEVAILEYMIKHIDEFTINNMSRGKASEIIKKERDERIQIVLLKA
ncbi:MAG: hypothetical protein Q4F83_10175 [Eubacteriales bacterium]|nr:hypothetical protein [Eubacteriales bacterium]